MNPSHTSLVHPSSNTVLSTPLSSLSTTARETSSNSLAPPFAKRPVAAPSQPAPDGGGYSWVQTGEAAASALLDAAVS